MNDLARLILLQDVLTVLMAGHILWVLRRAFGRSSVSPVILLLPVCVLAWGAAWSYVPALSATRLTPLPLGQAGVMLLALAGLTAFWLSPQLSGLGMT
ncbi:hypothetical protein N8I71_07410 [Roseibacterium sp. SDUM158016]|jgi:F0F1-type ATP synthase assembly protein I|uniref:hypothetical protein n=1 Tax=Roseicyclus sediminis TaxID=2980997 RepID=UPI0021CE4B37|nr:hypothetical protein [Roseibacterium sp. SDUM158016]MCU4652653.1 hypothetical protein [Roseibacterium sp. SDUM158016]